MYLIAEILSLKDFPGTNICAGSIKLSTRIKVKIADYCSNFIEG